jgi:hypothetical protein
LYRDHAIIPRPAHSASPKNLLWLIAADISIYLLINNLVEIEGPVNLWKSRLPSEGINESTVNKKNRFCAKDGI